MVNKSGEQTDPQVRTKNHATSKRELIPYIELKNAGLSPGEVYGKAFENGYKRYQCLLLISAVFNIEIHEAREIVHDICFESITE